MTRGFFRRNATQQSDYFPTTIGSFPHNDWITSQPLDHFPQWLDHLTTIGSFPNNEWITPKPLDPFPTTLIRSATLPSFDKAKLKNNKKTKGRWVNLGHERKYYLFLIWLCRVFQMKYSLFHEIVSLVYTHLMIAEGTFLRKHAVFWDNLGV